MENNPSPIHNRAIVFVHYDKHDLIDDYVYFYLDALREVSSYLIFVSTAELGDTDRTRVSEVCDDVVVRENIGYDFMSYKVGLDSFDPTQYDEVVICNDSVYGPFYPIEKMFQSMQKTACDFWGVTDSTDKSYHLQSYFIVFRKSVLQSDAFRRFWKGVKVLHDKDTIIRQYEVGLTTHLINNGFKAAVLNSVKASNLKLLLFYMKKLTPLKIGKKLVAMVMGKKILIGPGKVNPTHQLWKELLLGKKMPFIKIELLRDNPIKIDIEDYEEVIHKVSDYDTSLITAHLARMKVA